MQFSMLGCTASYEARKPVVVHICVFTHVDIGQISDIRNHLNKSLVCLNTVRLLQPQTGMLTEQSNGKVPVTSHASYVSHLPEDSPPGAAERSVGKEEMWLHFS